MSTQSKYSLLGSIVLGLASVAGCKPNSFQSVDSKPEVQKISQSFSCADEKAKNVELKNSKTNTLTLAKSCSADATNTRTPADIVFVIDITGSMNDSLNAVKNGVEQFATRLRQDKGWDARFAAIGYRDNIAESIPFTDEKDLAARIRSWKADGGEDPQEASQRALSAAVDLLKVDFASNSARANATKNILFIADAVGYSLNNDRSDFSTSQLERVYAAIPDPLKAKMKFYFSAAKEVDQCLRVTLFGCAKMGKSKDYAAFEQINSFAQKIALPGKGFDFPFTESILLNEFVDEFTPGQACILKSAVVKDAAGKEIGRINESGSFDLPRSVKVDTLNIEVERCCAGAASASTPAPGAKPTPQPDAAAACKPLKSSFTLAPKK